MKTTAFSSAIDGAPPMELAPIALCNLPSDAEILKKIAGGDTHALGILVDRYEAIVRRFVGRLAARPDEVDDLVQLTFLDVLRAAQRFDARLPARNWLVGLAAMVVRRHRRSVSRTAARLATWRSDPSCRTHGTLSEDLERREAAARAVRALQKLSIRKREVFVMLVLERASAEDTARALGVPVATVWTRLHHARRDLRHFLREKGTLRDSLL
jgi:RNA polymerase sigma-70 factor, ECF subfamily